MSDDHVFRIFLWIQMEKGICPKKERERFNDKFIKQVDGEGEEGGEREEGEEEE